MLKGRTPLIISLVLGLVAGLLSYFAVLKRQRDVQRGWNLVPIVVANVEIPEGSVVSFDMIAQRSVPEQFVTSSVVRPDSMALVENQRVMYTLQPGDPLLWSHFVNSKSSERLSAKVQKRARAITIEASKTSSVGGWVRPNDHVDVIGTFRDPQSNEQVAVTLLQNVIVLATGKITGTTNVKLLADNQRDYNNVSLLVLPEEAEILVLAGELGQLSLSLRNEEDADTIDDKSRASIHTLLSGERIRSLEKQRREIIQIIKGKGEVAGQSLK